MHVKDKEDPVEVQPPAGDCLAIAFRVESSGDCILFAPLCDRPSDIRQSPMMESITQLTKYLNPPTLTQLT